MTVLVGILCEDGVVVGSDSSATFSAGGQLRTIEQKVKKTFIVGNDLIFAGTGQVGLGQRFEHVLGALRNQPNFLQAGPFPVAAAISRDAIANFAGTQAHMGQFGALVAFASANHFHLCEFQISDFQPEFKTPEMWFVSMGSGQPITDPFLALIGRVFFDGVQPRLREGIFAAIWALDHAIELNSGGINGPSQVAVLTRAGPGQVLTARLLTDDEMGEHLNSVRGAEIHMRAYREILAGVAPRDISEPIALPQPPAPPPPPATGG